VPLNRVVALATAILTLTLAIVPVVGNFDWTSTAGVLAGIGAVAAVALKWLGGWQAHEAREAFIEPLVTQPPDPELDPDGVKHTGL
jgi:protein-S-isoprenylcysteine O-methyltransferase Ste14